MKRNDCKTSRYKLYKIMIFMNTNKSNHTYCTQLHHCHQSNQRRGRTSCVVGSSRFCSMCTDRRTADRPHSQGVLKWKQCNVTLALGHHSSEYPRRDTHHRTIVVHLLLSHSLFDSCTPMTGVCTCPLGT